jgi:hypothetical protein
MFPPATYHYDSLRLANEVRLLELKRGSGSAPISVSLLPIALDSIPPYEAISYCWGSSDRDCEVEVHDTGTAKPLSITTSLFKALQRFRQPDRTRLLWADAICINQDDNQEKGIQVSLMPKIYSQAHTVLIWLGEDMSGVDGVGESILQAKLLLPTEDLDAKMIQKASDGVLERVGVGKINSEKTWIDHDWKSIAMLLSRPWFHRKWIIQETALAQEATIVCGDITLPWKDLATLAMRITQVGAQTLLSDLLVKPTALKSLHNISILLLFQYYHSVGTLLDAVQSTTAFQCGDPRDHIFALSSMARDGSMIQPDYTLTVEEVFTNFTIKCLERGQFNILSLAPNTLFEPSDFDGMRLMSSTLKDALRPGMPTLSLPSWVPDLSRQGHFDSLASLTVRGKLFNAGGSADVNPPTVIDCKHLHLRGIMVDEIAVVLQSLPEFVNNPIPDNLRPEWLEDDKDAKKKNLPFALWLQNCRDFFTDCNGQLGHAESGILFRTMTSQLTGMHDRERRDLSEAFAAYIDHTIALSLERDAVISAGVGELYLQHGMMFHQSMYAIAGVRRLCMTPNGYYGLMPLRSQPEDIICVFAGAETPYIVRPIGNGTHSLIGPCYVDGIMDGEAVWSGEYQFQDIVLE